ncbi:MAG: aminotransferase class I/II-fold pyridoxal phosphate-dependent enzyme [Acidobacteria bacterium]|nr:aminotransferase class I/II-fold pyridoxal phosphate-dependent enzyme [Acidobacteriota bacterium]
MTVTLDRLTHDELLALSRDLNYEYGQFREAGLTLDLTRGKPSPSQLALADALDTGDAATGFIAGDGTDTRNYGGLDGLPEARALGAELLGVRADEVIAGGNSSLTLMYLYLMHARLYGPAGPGSAWRDSGTTRFLCPVPGYDRHFAILKDLGIEMVTVPMTDEGPDMDQVESLIREDPTIKGIWCVPKYSNPGGQTYSVATVQRLARLGAVAGPHFRIMWDNAYAVHDLDDTPPQLDNIMDACRAQGTHDSPVLFASTSKVTRAGAGISFMAGSPVNLTAFRARLQSLTIGPDKVNQLRHVRFLRDLEGVRGHMRKHAEILRPKFDLVQRRLSEALDDKGMGRWSTPRGGYFVSFDSLPGLASRIIGLAEDAGVKLTPAGATFPHGRDPEDTNIRLAPTFPDLADLDQAMRVFTVCVQLASVTQRLAA